jgi:hypothetical protein
MSCNAKKVRCSFLGVKPSAEIILSSDEGATPRPKRAKMSGLVPKAGPVTVEVKKPTEGTVELLDAIREQNALLRDLLIYQEQSALATALQAEWARPMTNYLGQIAHALEARNEVEGSGGSGSGNSGSGSGNKGKGKEKEQEENAESGSGNGDEDEDGEGDSDRDADGDETMGKSM